MSWAGVLPGFPQSYRFSKHLVAVPVSAVPTALPCAQPCWMGSDNLCCSGQPSSPEGWMFPFSQPLAGVFNLPSLLPCLLCTCNICWASYPSSHSTLQYQLFRQFWRENWLFSFIFLFFFLIFKMRCMFLHTLKLLFSTFTWYVSDCYSYNTQKSRVIVRVWSLVWIIVYYIFVFHCQAILCCFSLLKSLSFWFVLLKYTFRLGKPELWGS